jgi:hypothetical protein
MITKPIVSVEDVRSHLPVRAGDESFDARLASLILVATTQIESATGRRFTRQSFTQVFPTIETGRYTYDFANPTNEDGLISRPRQVRYYLAGVDPLASPAPTVHYDPSGLFGEQTLVAPGGYSLDQATGTIALRIATRDHPAALRVVYTAGYAIDIPSDSLRVAAPETLKMACVLQAVAMFNRFNADNLGMDIDRGKGGADTGRYVTRNGLTPEAAGLVALYRRHRTGLA